MENTHSQIPAVSRRIIFFGAAYDLLVTAGFATPWTAALVLQILSDWHMRLGLPGVALPVIDPVTMLYVNFSGTLVLMWGGLRLYRPTLLHGAIDSAGRIVISLWMIFAVLAGATPLVVPLLLGEIIWFTLQSGAIAHARRRK